MKRYWIIGMLIFAFLLGGCGQSEQPAESQPEKQTVSEWLILDGSNAPAVKLTEDDKTAVDAIKTYYSEAELALIDEAAMDLAINQMNERYPMEFVKKDRGHYYAIYRSSQSVLYLEYTSDGRNYVHILFQNVQPASAFDALEEGRSTAEEVKQIDPNGKYDRVANYQGISLHATQDCRFVRIVYISDEKSGKLEDYQATEITVRDELI